MKLVTTGVFGTALRTALEHRRDALETLFGFGICAWAWEKDGLGREDGMAGVKFWKGSILHA
jgi:hypothetical protein